MSRLDVADLTARMRREVAARPGYGGEYAIFAGAVAAVVRPGRSGMWAQVSDAERLAAVEAALTALDEATAHDDGMEATR